MASPPKSRPGRGGGKRKSASAGKAAPARKAAPAPKRPPQISAAKWKAYAPSYKKRLASGYAKHPLATRQQLRGKHAGEHVTRKQRQEEAVQAWAALQGRRSSGPKTGGRDPAEIAASAFALISDKGMKAWREMARETVTRPRGAGQIDTLEMYGFDWGDYDGDDTDLFYHPG
jgi:hypothetical protein